MRTKMKKPIAVLLSALMLLTVMSVGFVLPASAVSAYQTLVTDGGIHTTDGTVVYGPYIDLDPGNYSVTFTGSNMSGRWDVVAEGITFASGSSLPSSSSFTVNFTLNKHVTRLEARIVGSGTIISRQIYQRFPGMLVQEGGINSTDTSIAWGPYVTLPAGNYVVQYFGENMQGYYDVFNGNTYASAATGTPESYRELSFSLASETSSLEFRLVNGSGKVNARRVYYVGGNTTTYTASYNANGGSVSPTNVNYNLESTAVLPTPSRGGCTFDGWLLAAKTGNWEAGTYPAGTSLYGKYGNANFVAQWIIHDYTLTLDANGGAIESSSIPYTVESTDTLPLPTRAGYDFAGWKVTTAAGSWAADAEFAAGTSLTNKYGDATLTAQWSVRHDTAYTINNYYMNADGTYPDTPETQTFVGTTENTVTAADAASAPANYTLDTAMSDDSITILGDGSAALNLYYARNTNTVLFKNTAGETVQTDTLYYGATPDYTGTAPTLAGTDANTYTFLGWTANAPAEPGSDAAYFAANNLPPVTADVTYYPYFGAETNSYDITFTVDGADTVLSFPYGATPAFNGIPEKAADAQNTYTFSGWSPAIEAVTGEAAYVAQFTATPVSYLVRATAGAGSTITDVTGIYNFNDTVDFTVTVAEGYTGTPVVSVNGTPVEAAAANGSAYDYSVTVTGNTQITVADLTKQTFTIKFDVDGAETEKTVAYGDTPTYGSVPTKAATAQYTYAFTGWSPEIVPATADATYTAQFSETLRSYPVYVNGGVGSTISIASGTRDYGTELTFTVTVDAAYSDSEPTVTVGDTVLLSTGKEGNVFSYTAVTVTGETEISVSDLTKNTYIITFNVEGDETTKTVSYGETPDAGFVPTKAQTTEYSYAFMGWNTAADGSGDPPAPATADETYYAVFTPTAIPAHTHSFDTYVRTVAATCVAGGYDEYICTCGMTEQRNATAIAPANHAKDPITVGARAATETEDGYTGDVICPACGATITEGHVDPHTATPHVHSFDTLVSHADATCAAKAYDIYVCSCGEQQKVESGEVDPDNHAAAPMTVGQRDATTESYGYTGDVICPACDHVLSVGTVIEKLTVPHVHSFDTLIDSGEATCVAKAYTVYQCACGETERTETGEKNMNNHVGELKLLGAHAATATADGYSGDTYCLACGTMTEEGHVIDKLDPGHTHSYDTEIESAPATCIAKAYTIYQCECGDTKKVETGEKDAANHVGEIKLMGYHAATETADGYSGDKYCLACGELVEAGHVLEHTGSTTPENPTQPDDPGNNGGSNTDTRIPFLEWLRNFIKKLLALFKIGGGEGSIC